MTQDRLDRLARHPAARLIGFLLHALTSLTGLNR